MAKTTGIAWARSTRNLWAGCTKVGPGCDGCYAEAFNRWTQGKDPESGEAKNWGPGRPRIPYLKGAFKDLYLWNKLAIAEAKGAEGGFVKGHPGFWPVFINTFSDFFDNEVPHLWREKAFPVLEDCTALSILLVTKRVGNVAKMVPERWLRYGFPPNVRLLITVVNQQEADRDIPKLLELPCKNGISYEPALGWVDWRPWWLSRPHPPGWNRGLEWIIVGGESSQSGHTARPFNIEWARYTVKQCKEAGVPVFVKQLGSLPFVRQVDDDGGGCLSVHEPKRIGLRSKDGSDINEFPEDLRIQEFPA